MSKKTQAGSELSEGLGAAWGEASEHLKLIDLMASHQLPTGLDQDVRDLHRIIYDHAWRYEDTDYGDMTMSLVRSLTRLVCAASKGAA